MHAKHSCPTLNVFPWRVGEPLPLSVLRLAPDAAFPLVLGVDRRDGFNPAVLSQLIPCLTADEMCRYVSYRDPADAERFLLGRGFLRILLASILGMPPAAVTIHTGHHGKPFCVSGPEFSVSHSGDLVLIAVHSSLAVGVDVEVQPGPSDWESFACRLLPSQMLSAIHALPRQWQSSAFLQAWCHLEAQLKMVGIGFHSASVAPADASGFRQWALVLPRGYLGSVAMVEI